MGKKIHDIVKAIEDHEYYNNGFQHLSGAWVKVKNVKITESKVIADVTLCSGLGEVQEKFCGCEYPLEQLQGQLIA